jgi:uroporphyrinogen-III synthase
MNDELKNLTVLVTRPVHQADNFVDLVEEAGGHALRFPVIEIQPLELQEADRELLQQLTDCLIFISANAVHIGVAELSRLVPGKLPVTRVMAIGQATARALLEHGITPDLVPPSPYNSEALLAMPEMQDVRGRRYTIIKGKGGREYLNEQLQARGGIVRTVDVYTRVRSRENNDILQQLLLYEDVVVAITSVKGLHYLFEMASAEQGAWLKKHARFLVPGNRVADAVHDCHIKHAPIVAENATDEAMIRRLLQSA